MSYSGYKRIFIGEGHPSADSHGFVAEHRYVAEQKLGRPLRKGEVVHHCDRNRLNNNPDNIAVFVSRQQHSTYHAGGNLIELPDGTYDSVFPEVINICEYCGKEFKPKEKDTKYCCKECYMLASRKVERPSKKELKNLLLEFNMSQIAQIYNVTDNAIRRWCDLYRLPKRLNGIKQLREKEKKKREEKEKLALEKQRQKEAVQFKKQLDKLL